MRTAISIRFAVLTALAGTACNGAQKAPSEPAAATAPAPAVPIVSVPAPSAREEAPAPAASKAPKTAGEKFIATVRIDAKPGGKKFQGVWLEREGGDRWVIAYRPEEVWKSFGDARVEVIGERYEPPGQRISAQHFRVFTMRRLDESLATYVEVGPEQSLTGVFEEKAWPMARKAGGEIALWFTTSEGAQYLVIPSDKTANAPRGQSIRIQARRMVHSRFVAHVGGDYLYVVDVVK